MSTGSVAVASVVEKAARKGRVGLDDLFALRAAVRSLRQERSALSRALAALEAEKLTADERARRRGVYCLCLGRFSEAHQAVAGREDGLALYVCAVAACAAGHLEEAVQLFAKAKDKLNDARVLVDIASCERQRGESERAAQLLQEAEKAGVATADFFFECGFLREIAGEFEAALELYRKALEVSEGHPGAAFRLAYHYDLRGLDEEAIKLYGQVTGRGTMFTNAMINLGLLLEDRGDHERAILCYREALEADPGNARARMYLGDSRAALREVYDEQERKKTELLESVLRVPVTDFELSVRSRNCLTKMNIRCLGDLVRRTEQEMLSSKNFGETSLREIKQMLASKGLRLGMGREEEDLRTRRERLRQRIGDSSVLVKPVAELNLSVRARKCMTRLELQTVGDLIEKSEADLIAVKNFGQTSLNEVKRKLAELGLSLRPLDAE